jgi:branched-chain amino acid transport system substrate-binding protein
MQKARVKRVGALLVGLSLVAAACGSDDDESTTTDAETETSEAVEDAETETSEAVEDAETETSEVMDDAETETSEVMDDAEGAEGGSTEGVFVVGGLLPETGSLAFLGPPEIAGVNLAVEDINAAGGVVGSDIEYLPGDSGDNGEVANATVDRLLAQDVDAFIGAASSGVSLTVIDKITQAGKIQFSPANTSPSFTTYPDSDLYFRTAPSDTVQGAALADILVSDGNTSVTFAVRNDDYGLGLLEFTSGPYADQGGVVDAEIIYDPEAENFDDVVADVVAADSDAIVIIGFDETGSILTGLIEAGFGPADKALYGTDGNMSNALAAQFDDPTVLAGMRGTLPGVDVEGELADFQAALLEVDPELVDYSYAAESYDAIVVMALAATVAGTDEATAVAAEIVEVTRGGEKCTSYADCLALLEADPTTDIDYDGVSGPLEFRDEGEPTQASILTLEYDADGVLQTVGSVQGSVEV